MKSAWLTANSHDYLAELIAAFQAAAHPGNALPMSKYMKNRFPFSGIKKPERSVITKPFLQKESLPPFGEAKKIISALWDKDEREYQYFALELAQKYTKHWEAGDLGFIRELILQKSWWDSVDTVASNILGPFLRRFPHLKAEMTAWNRSGELWLERSSLIFQLKYGKETDIDLLENFIAYSCASKEFFIRKAIGWSLRQYFRVNPERVKLIVDRYPLSPFSVREALKHL